MPLTYRDKGTSATRLAICSGGATVGTLWKEVLSIAAGGEAGRWTWTWHAGPGASPDKHGTAATREAAQEAIEQQWKAWLDAAGLTEK